MAITPDFAALADKWHEVPGGGADRLSTRDLLGLPDGEFLARWEAISAERLEGRAGVGRYGWLHLLYDDWSAGRAILEVGSGLGVDGVRFAERGAHMTFLDVAATNLLVVKRIFALRGLPEPRLQHLTAIADIDALDGPYDGVVAIGSLHHAPAIAARTEFAALSSKLAPGGRFLMWAYPQTRWIREGRLPFDQWGRKTDGDRTPWAEWYDLPKLLAQLAPDAYEPVLSLDFHDGDFCWFDLVKQPMPTVRASVSGIR